MCSPCGWQFHQYAMEMWLERAVQRWPHLTSNASDADVVYVSGTNFGRWCASSLTLATQFIRKNGNAKGRMKYQDWVNNRRVDFAERFKVCPSEYVAQDNVTWAPFSEIAPDGHRMLGCLEMHKRDLWSRITRLKQMRAASSALKLVAYTDSECAAPWTHERSLDSDVVLVKDRATRSRPQDIVAPFSVSSPPWLSHRGSVPVSSATASSASVAAASSSSPSVAVTAAAASSSASSTAAMTASVAPLPAAPWVERAPLLFFAGHVPKLYLGQTQRYELWRQLRREPGVRAISSTINCTVGAYAICRTPERWPTEWATYCQEPCGSRRQCSTSDSGLRRQCRAYRKVDWEEELPDIRKTAVALPRLEYLRTAMGHRFFLIAPGDFVTTPKLAEAIAMGGAGGPLPVIVLPAHAADASSLPYSSWLDYCSIGYLVSAKTAKGNMRLVLDRLRAVSADEAAAKHAALRAASPAFTVVPASSVDAPSAPEHLLWQACELAHRRRNVTRPPSELPKGANRVCVL